MSAVQMALDALKEAINIIGFGTEYDKCAAAIAALEAVQTEPSKDVILEALKEYACSESIDDTGSGSKLVDMLTHGGDIGPGLREIEALADFIWGALADAVQAEPVAWEWRKRIEGYWSMWEPLVPPYMDARQLSKTDPDNYQLRALYATPQQAAAPEPRQCCEKYATCTENCGALIETLRETNTELEAALQFMLDSDVMGWDVLPARKQAIAALTKAAQ